MSDRGNQAKSELVRSIEDGDAGALKKSLSRGCNPEERIDRAEWTPLIRCVHAKQRDCVQVLLEARADPNGQDRAGWTALHYAAQNHDLGMVTLLLNHGAQTEIEDGHGNTPLCRAVFEARGRGEVIIALLNAGADRNHKNKSGTSPLSLAQSIANYDNMKFFGA